MLRLTSEANGKTVEKIFLSPEAANAVVTIPDRGSAQRSRSFRPAARRRQTH
jgi:hypothetical protein